MRNKTMTQTAIILAHLMAGNSITQRHALMDFCIMALPRRIKDLKEDGFEICKVMEENSGTSQRFARYYMRKVSIKKAKKLLSEQV